MVDTLYDGHDELYHHAKFGGDRTTRAGCRCENVVFFTVFTGNILPVLFLLSSKKINILPPSGKKKTMN